MMCETPCDDFLLGIIKRTTNNMIYRFFIVQLYELLVQRRIQQHEFEI